MQWKMIKTVSIVGSCSGKTTVAMVKTAADPRTVFHLPTPNISKFGIVYTQRDRQGPIKNLWSISQDWKQL